MIAHRANAVVIQKHQTETATASLLTTFPAIVPIPSLFAFIYQVSADKSKYKITTCR
jgi:hypothetical protein